MTENSAASTKLSRPNRRSIGHSLHYSKRKGMMGELIFVVKATSMGFAVSKPYGDTEAYDLLIEENGRLLRIQVKSVFTTSRWGYSVSVQRHSRGHGRPVIQYSAQEIDFIAAYVVPHDAWYIVPVFEIVSRAHIRLYPEGAKRNDGALFEKYREAWDLLRLGRATSTEAGCEARSKIKKRK
ncbi:MAG TPA: group I intron-associated PD-(D/E)XK endonuclease [Terriglobales bacterium]|nr:group I intron-associated PD-(D/E)XK endonuclease [Terriglobales bacterium]